MLVLIDNYDSFTHNVARYFTELGVAVTVFRHDAVTLEALAALPLSHLVISPGPCTPEKAGISLAAISYFAGKLPILGVCLGHQAMGQVFGGRVIKARLVMHGKTSPIYHQGQGLFLDLPQPFTGMRYHSLILDAATLPNCFAVTAWTQNAAGDMDEIMAIQHRAWPLFGVQFHPESILTERGIAILRNFLQQK